MPFYSSAGAPLPLRRCPPPRLAAGRRRRGAGADGDRSMGAGGDAAWEPAADNPEAGSAEAPAVGLGGDAVEMAEGQRRRWGGEIHSPLLSRSGGEGGGARSGRRRSRGGAAGEPRPAQIGGRRGRSRRSSLPVGPALTSSSGHCIFSPPRPSPLSPLLWHVWVPPPETRNS
uniref:DUF834 domain-containing protein n=1 Tax=Oryza meridionalis TaxID=40149 RepID=A0A0E0DVW5_9ORYZ